LGKGKINFGSEWSHLVYETFDGTSLRRTYLDTQPGRAVTISGREGRAKDQHKRNRSLFIVYPGDIDKYSPDFNPANITAPSFAEDGGVFTTKPIDGCVLSKTGKKNNLCEGSTLGGAYKYIMVGPTGTYTSATETYIGLDTNIHLDLDVANFFFAYGVTDTLDLGITIPVIKTKAVIDLDTRNLTQVTGSLSAQEKCIGLSANDTAECYLHYTALLAINQIKKHDFNTSGKAAIHPGQHAKDEGGYMLRLGLNHRNAYLQARPDGGALDKGVLLKSTTSSASTKTGFGDIKLRGKWNFLKSSAVDLAVRGDVSFPTGSRGNFQGTGEYIFNTTLIASKTFGWFSPHANIGLDMSPGGNDFTMARLVFGADARVHERITVSASFLGSKFLESNGHKNTQLAVAPGLKARLWKNLVLTTAAVIQVNNKGLRVPVIPTLGLEYVFR
jgi:hypothetical protein